MKLFISILIFSLTAILSCNPAHSMEKPPSRFAALLSLTPSQFERELRNDGKLINRIDEHGKTLLINAIEEGKVKHVKTLLVLKADPFINDKKKESAFHAAAKTGNLQVARLLAKFYGDTPEWEQMMQEHNGELEKALDRKDFVRSPLSYAQQLYGNTSCAFIFKNFHKYKNKFSKALVLGDFKAISEAIENNPRRVDAILTPDCTPLSFAALLEDAELTELLLAAGATDVGTFLTRDMAFQIPKPIKELLNKHGVNYIPESRQYHRAGDPQLELTNAVLESNCEKIARALASRATLNGFDYKGNTALHWACTTGNPDLIAHLIKLGADLNLVDHIKGRNGLRWALRMHKNSSDKGGRQITTSELLPCFFLLICAGADSNIEDIHGQSIHHWLPLQDFNEIETELVNRVLGARALTKEQRKLLLEDIYRYQMNDMNQWRKDDQKFDLRSVFDVKRANVKNVAPNAKPTFKDIYKGYIE